MRYQKLKKQIAMRYFAWFVCPISALLPQFIFIGPAVVLLLSIVVSLTCTAGMLLSGKQ